uniref:Tc1-like transposase DDE domain-containing protein n=1 Tax=Schizaphis graminum TaxID=13262 RepID=A0A2S2PJK5_SCHGA
MAFQQEELSTSSSSKLTIKENKLIILHIRSDDGFLPGGFMYFKTNKNTIDYQYYHDEINGKIFQNWFEEVLLPLLKENAIIVMNNVPCHSVKTEKVPNLAWKRHCIVNWLISKGEDFDPSELVKVDLMKIVQRLKPSSRAR